MGFIKNESKPTFRAKAQRRKGFFGGADHLDQVDSVDVNHGNMVPSVHNHGKTVALIHKIRI